MAWIPEDKNTQASPVWSYKDGMDFATVLPDECRHFALLTGELDPTKTWVSPLSAWIHEFKAPSGKFVTVVCNKWEEACPFCYENERYKQKNPNYKNTGGRMPFGLSKKALLQVWDFQQNRVLFFLAGKRIQEGMDFILTRMTDQFKGVVAITRSGKGLNTNYRVDISPMVVDNNIKLIIQQTILDLQSATQKVKLSHQEIFLKTGLHPVTYWDSVVKSGNMFDISGWGAIPDLTNKTENQPVSKIHVEQPVNVPQNLDINTITSIQNALAVVCTVGVYINKTMRDIIKETGKPYIQYLANTGTDVEKAAVQVLLKNWEHVKV